MPEPKTGYAPAQRKTSLLASVTAALEVTLVLGVSLAAAVLAQSLIQPGLAESLGLGDSGRDLFAASRALLQQFAVQYGALFILVVLIALWRRRTGARAYALGTGNLTRPQIVRYGVLVGLVAGTPATAVLMLQQYAPIGVDTPMWSALRAAPKDLSYWTFLAVSGFVVVPVVEELAWRGYALGRFSEELGPGAAVVATAIPFALLHAQYASSDPAMIAASVSVVILSFATCLATIRTGTLWPAVIAHAIINSPVEGVLGWIRVAATVAAIIMFAGPIALEARLWLRLIFRRDTAGAIVPLLIMFTVASAILLTPGLSRWWLIGTIVLAAVIGIAVDRSAWKVRADRSGR